MTLGIVVHELLHSLGFLHQQSVPNRDLYVTIHYANINPVIWRYFKRFDPSDVTDLGYPYDFTSIMHYENYEFSWNGNATITSKDPRVTKLGQRDGLNQNDISKIKKLYNCFYYQYDTNDNYNSNNNVQNNNNNYYYGDYYRSYYNNYYRYYYNTDTNAYSVYYNYNYYNKQ